MIDYTSIPEGVPLILTMKFPCVEPYEITAVYRGMGRHGRGKTAPVWESASGGELHAGAVSGITAWRAAPGKRFAAFAPDIQETNHDS